MEKISCSVGILTFNSGMTLRRALESVKDFDDIILCDGGSTDETLSIAQEYGAKVIVQDPVFQKEGGTLADYAGVRNQCLAEARYDWFFYIDSDEVATPELINEIRSIVNDSAPRFFIYNISPRIVLDGRIIEHSSNYPGWQKRFFNRKSNAHFRKAIHERITYDDVRYPEGFLQGHWHYFISAEEDADKTERYARMDAQQYQTNKFGRFFGLFMKKIATIMKIALKSLFNRFWYGSERSMPLALEYRRIRYQLYQLMYLWYGYIGKDI